MTSPEDLAAALLARAASSGQAVVRCHVSMPVDEVRERVRARAKADGLRVRTGMLDDVLVVARADSPLWTDDTATMRRKLAAPDEVGQVG